MPADWQIGFNSAFKGLITKSDVGIGGGWECCKVVLSSGTEADISSSVGTLFKNSHSQTMSVISKTSSQNNIRK
jgi:hypothetical protein